jgi:ABC-type branched-subunit amino acid transport system permease subunit
MLGITSPEIFFQLLVNGILLGAVYAIAAIGLSIIFGTMKILFFAQGTIIILAAYACYWLFTLLHIDPYLSIIIILLGFLLFGSGIYHGLFKRVARAEGTSLLIAFGLFILLENLMTIIWTPDARAIRTSYTGYGFKFLGLKISFTRFIALIMALISTLGVYLFLKKTLMGKALRAASENLQAATLVGITPYWVNRLAFAVGIGLCGIAGVAVATIYGFTPYFGFVFTLKAFITMALGGIGSALGALLGGILLGLIESMGGFLTSPGWADAIAYAAFLLVLMLKPEGLFSKSSGRAGDRAISPTYHAGEAQTIIGYTDKKKIKRIALPSLILLPFCALPFILNTETSYFIYFLFILFSYIALTQAWNLLAGYTGQMSLGHHAFFGFGGYVTGLIWLRDITGTGYYFDPLTMFLSGLGSAILAVAIGIPLLSRLRGDYFALGTLGLGEILRVVFSRSVSLTGGQNGLYLPASVYASFRPHYFTALILAVLATAVTYLMVKSRTGLALVAVKEDETAAAAKGINILKYKVLAFATGAFIAGVCGSLYAFYTFHVNPANFFSLNWTVYPVVMCTLGGTGTITGPIIGALCLTGVFELAKIYLPVGHAFVSGLLIIIVVLILPNGLIRMGVMKKLRV